MRVVCNARVGPNTTVTGPAPTIPPTHGEW